MDYEKAYKDALERAKGIHQFSSDLAEIKRMEQIFPELAESEDELTWLTKYIEEEAYSLSIDIRDEEDRIKLKKLQRSLAWLEKQQEKTVWTDNDRTMAFTLMRDVDQITYISEEGKNKRLEWLNSLEDRFNKEK